MSLDWGGGLFGSQSAFEALQSVGVSRDGAKKSRDTLDESRDVEDDESVLSDGSDLEMSDEEEDVVDHVTNHVTEGNHVTEDVTENDNHVTAQMTRFPSPSPDDDFIEEMLGDRTQEDASRDLSRDQEFSGDSRDEHEKSRDENPTSSSSHDHNSSSRATRYITLYSGMTLSRAKKHQKTTRLRTMQQDEESLKNHYGVDVSGMRRKLVEKLCDSESRDKSHDQTESREKSHDKSHDQSKSHDFRSDAAYATGASRQATTTSGIGSRDSDLWVEKLRPQKLLDLFGHSDRHKDVLYWLSEWNSFIFQVPSQAVQFKAKQKEKWQSRGLDNSRDQARGTEKSRDFFKPESRDKACDRPQKKILLVHGEPGTGKTTAVSVLARHLGFNTLEMNASDDRGSEAFKKGVLGPMRSHSVTSKDRPNCVILDEIDGADPVFIDKLVRLVSRDEKDEMWHMRKSRGKSHDYKPLVSRPIICIANNLHGLLYKLRPHCRVVNYGRLSADQSLRIMQNVFRTELSLTKLTSKQNRFLADISSSCDGDIRQAINVLQFGTAEKSHVDKSALWSNVVTSCFSHVPVGREKTSHVNSLTSRASRCGEWNKLIFGAFSVYVTCSGQGNLASLNAITQLGDWLTLYDSAERLGSRDYHAYVMAAFSVKFGSTSSHHVTPETDYVLTNRTQTQLLRLGDVHSNIPVEMRRSLSKQTLLDDVGMFLGMLSKQKKGITPEQLTSLASSLTSLGVTLKKENSYNEVTSKREEVFVFSPPVGELSRDEEEVSRDSVFLEALYKVLTPDPSQKRPGEFSQVQVTKKKRVDSEKSRDESHDEVETRGDAETRDSKPKSKSSTLLDFFTKEKTEVTPSQIVRNEIQEAKDTLNTWVSYFEGYSNAVRRDLTWEQLWME
ncbi:Chromosome transmission fidelity protein 18-like protein [Yarrowia sp. B02]|nr:Chromosome transmission fidelity protein 18-like protein [Yarrowia sp. B02]